MNEWFSFFLYIFQKWILIKLKNENEDENKIKKTKIKLSNCLINLI
mgnify:CR=1 FL=1